MNCKPVAKGLRITVTAVGDLRASAGRAGSGGRGTGTFPFPLDWVDSQRSPETFICAVGAHS
jgi:hypothetical protein